MVSMQNILGLVVSLAVGLYAFAYVGVPAITEIFNADTSAWDSGAASLLTIIPIFVVLGVAIVFIKPAMDDL